MKFVFSIAVSILLFTSAFSQGSIDKVTEEILQNNTGLVTLESQQRAQELLNLTGNYLADPEFGFAWFDGSPATLGSKTNISLIQSFDFPTAYHHRSIIAKSRNEQLPVEYQAHLSDLMLQVRLICLELIYNNALFIEYEKRLQHSQLLEDGYSQMLQAGQVNLLEYNKAKLNLLNLQKEAEKIIVERNELRNKLTALNGGIPISIEDTIFPAPVMVEDFEQWYSKAEQSNPVLIWLRQETEISKRQERLQKTLNLPAFSAGYVSEALTHEAFRGFTVGISIPLWENKNTLKHARAQSDVMENTQIEQSQVYYSHLKTQHEKALSLRQATEEYRNLLQSVDNSDLLFTSWKQGEISLTNYILELSLFYQSTDKVLEMELELHQALSRLYQYVYTRP